MAGGPGSIVIRWSAMLRIASGTSNTAWGMIVAPATSEATIPAR
jgi:hypothetical protein